ncbi:ATP-binding protein [Maridesulfovibrio hydrothermalis]|uniref:Putative anti-sigma regulatory factor, serine/threonine protein kinase n=1 Tax=Maridesulfovibrio hydrothermalis AM13 = DSM 14728 TaxID=1121451 RepID=L0R8U9_9BACT|nr:ATP-binding protein [Maridesulfovibrio hydrothermalis]CCO22652.1 putative anti-sigma regulatory factor, serine/threonine protein kinase [Maridesulfovibrio hydrothermalis AM13 = DSM 14728]
MHNFVLEAVPTPEESREIARKAIHIMKDFISDESLLHDIDLVLTEGCSNVARHAYDSPAPCNRLELTIKIVPREYVIFEIADWGKGLCSKSIDFTMPDPEAVGGRGMFIMSELMDSFELVRKDGKNIIRLTRNIKEEQWLRKE